jgi:hypothetical protein
VKDSRRRGGRCRAGAVLASAVLMGLSACAPAPVVEVDAGVDSSTHSSTDSGVDSDSRTDSDVNSNTDSRTESSTESSADSGVRPIRAYITGYSYFDNTPPGSAQVSHPVLHTVAGGEGTYDDPITVAVGHVRAGGEHILDWPPGTRFYVPNLRRYLIVEDTCGDGERPQDGPCHVGYPDEATTWLDVWVGGEGGTEEGAERCMVKITGVWDVYVDPSPDFPVEVGEIYSPNDTGRSGVRGDGCTRTFGNAHTIWQRPR